MHLTNQDSLVPQSGVVEVHPSEAFQTVTDTSHSSGCEYPLGIFFTSASSMNLRKRKPWTWIDLEVETVDWVLQTEVLEFIIILQNPERCSWSCPTQAVSPWETY